MDRGALKPSQGWTPKHRGQAGFTLVEILVVITIIGLIMALVGPRVLNYLGESKAKAAKIQIESFSSALDLYYLDLGRYPNSSEGLAALTRSNNAPGWNGPVSARRRGAQRPVGPRLRLSLARRAVAVRYHFSRIRWARRRQWNGNRHCQRRALSTAEREAGFHADRNPVRARHHRPARGHHPAGDPAGDHARQARELRGGDRGAAEGGSQRRAAPANPGDDPGRCGVAIDPLRRDRPRSSACPTTFRWMRCWRRGVRIDMRGTIDRLLSVGHVVRRRAGAGASGNGI